MPTVALAVLSAAAGTGLTHDADLATLRAAQGLASAPLDALGTYLSTVGSLELTTVLYIGVCGFLAFRGRRRLAWRLLVAYVVASLLEVALKTLLPVPPVPEHFVRAPDYAPLVGTEPIYPYPSGHMLRATMLLGVPILATGSRIILALSAVFLAAMGASRVYMGVHWPSDVVGGVLLGAVAVGWAFRPQTKG